MGYSDGDGRPSIPAEIRRKVLVEAGHRCAIPTCRYIEVDIHHIIPWAKCQKHEYDNLIALCPNCHRRADRDEIDRKSLRLYKSNLRYAHDKYSHLEIDILFELKKAGFGDGLLWPEFNLLLIKRIIDSGFVDVERGGGVSIGGMNSSPARLFLTNKGEEFMKELGTEEL
ncbi:HNH endonuclease [Sinorhizobium medicae]|nr:HNH endonuclease [Sinorhizobium medicae]